MPFNLFPPVLYQSVPFGDRDAYLDWLGHHSLEHEALARITGTTFVLTDDLKNELLRHSEMHTAVDKALNIAPVYDLVSYDLSDKASWEGFMQAHGNEHQRERLAAGV